VCVCVFVCLFMCVRACSCMYSFTHPNPHTQHIYKYTFTRCVCVCVHACLSMFFVCSCVCARESSWVGVCMSEGVSEWVRMCLCVYECMCASVWCKYTHMYVCAHIHVYLYAFEFACIDATHVQKLQEKAPQNHLDPIGAFHPVPTKWWYNVSHICMCRCICVFAWVYARACVHVRKYNDWLNQDGAILRGRGRRLKDFDSDTPNKQTKTTNKNCHQIGNTSTNRKRQQIYKWMSIHAQKLPRSAPCHVQAL